MEDVSCFSQLGLEILRDVPACHVYPADAVLDCEAFEDRYRVRDTVARIKHYACCPSGSVQGKNSLDGGVQCRDVEGFKEDLSGSFPVTPWVEWGFSEQDRMLQGAQGFVSCDSKILIEQCRQSATYIFTQSF